MTSEEILRLAEFDVGLSYERHATHLWPQNLTIGPQDIWHSAGRSENARLRPLIEALVADREALRDALRDITAECNRELAQSCPNADCDYQAICAVKSVNICDDARRASDERWKGME
jgi:hypothetical protein